jgi:hypothetical protein
MASTGDIVGGTAASTTGSPSGDTHWTNPSNALVDNTSAATCTGSLAVSYWLHITNFGFSIPTGSTINGITVKVRRKCSSTNDWFTQQCRLVNSGSILGVTKNVGGSFNYWPTTAAIETFGGSADLWSWTPVIATINSSTFGIQIYAEDDSPSSETASIEVVWMNIDYTPPAGGGVSSFKSMAMWF